MSKPTILLAIADYGTDRTTHLRGLGKELDALKEALKPAEEAGLCRVVSMYSATVTKIVEAFNDPNQKITIFHFAGHANGYQLMLSEGNAKGERLAHFLGQQPHLKLVFLNGCATQLHAKSLHRYGVPASITTSMKIKDEAAVRFAESFYKNLAEGANLYEAFRQYEYVIDISGGMMRDLFQEGAQPEGFPWEWSCRKGSEVVTEWSLPEAANNALFGLPRIEINHHLPEKPFIYLNWFGREHAEIFFGRSNEIKKLYDKVNNNTAPPLILLHGNSGVGKSSLLEAGLLPRLEKQYTVFYLRRRRTFSALGTIINKLRNEGEKLAPYNISDLKTWWMKAEAKAGRPLVCVLDQLEEAITRPLKGKGSKEKSTREELETLAEAISQCFLEPNDQPQGKLILCFRKEYQPELESLFSRYMLPRSNVFISPLDRRGIIDAITGLTKNERTKQRYNLTIEEGLAGKIADDLLEDDEVASVAPVLQILLTEMWNNAIQTDAVNPVFKKENYLKLSREGIHLNDFLHQQLEIMGKQFPKASQTGLLLDILHYFTTERGTSAKYHEKEIVGWYQEIDVDIPSILLRFRNNYILDYNEDGKLKLAHDTLAPVVTELFETSQAPAQIAHRILVNKLKSIAFSGHQLYLEELELGFIREGRKGMRTWTEDMEELVAASEARIAELDQIRRAQRLIGRAKARLRNPTIAYRYASYAWLANPKNEEASHLLQQIVFKAIYDYRKRVYGTPLYRDLGVYSDDINYAEYAPDGSCIAVACDDATAKLIDLTGREILVLKGHTRYLHTVHFSADGEWVLTGSGDNTARVWNRDGKCIKIIEGHDNDVRDIQVSVDKKYFLTASEDCTVKLWNVADGKLVNTFEHTNDVRVARFSTDGKYILTAAENGMAKLITIDGVAKQKIKGHSVDLLYADISPQNKFLVTCGEESTAKVWTFDGRLQCYLKGHTDDIRCVRFSPDGQFIITASEDHTAKIWNLEGEEVCTLLGHTDDLTAACFSPDGRFVVTASEDRSVRLWNLEGLPVDFVNPDTTVTNSELLQHNNILHLPFAALIEKINALDIADLPEKEKKSLGIL